MEIMFYSIVFLLMAVALIATILVGVSKKNREGNPDYDQKKKSNIVNLTIYYVIAIVIGIALFVYFMYQ